MDSFLANLGQLITEYPAWMYIILGVGMALQGEITIIIAMYLVAGHILTWWQFIIGTFFIVALYEHILFLITKGLRRTRFGWKLYRKYKARRRIQLYMYFLKQNLARLVIIAKFVPGMNFLVITLAGWSKISLRAFSTSYLLAVSIWFVGISAIAYFVVSGFNYLKATEVFEQAEVGILVLIILIFAAEYFIKKLFRERALEIEKKKREEILAETEDEDDENDKTEDEKRMDFWEPRNNGMKNGGKKNK